MYIFNITLNSNIVSFVKDIVIRDWSACDLLNQ